MYYLQKLPLLFALIAAILSGALGLSCSMSNKRILTIMIISMVVFFAVGLYARSVIINILEQLIEKNIKKKEQEEQEEQKKNFEENDQSSDEDFEPLRVVEYVKNELKQS